MYFDNVLFVAHTNYGGLLFEQGSSRGHAQESENGVLTFNFAVRNQLVNAIATIKPATEQRELLLKHQVEFFKEINSFGNVRFF